VAKRSVESVSCIPAEIASLIPSDAQGLFEKPPLLRTEDRDKYWRRVRGFINSFGPQKTAEWIWLRDLANCCWKLDRLRQPKAFFEGWLRMHSDYFVDNPSCPKSHAIRRRAPADRGRNPSFKTWLEAPPNRGGRRRAA
jgi:hypothetical protein